MEQSPSAESAVLVTSAGSARGRSARLFLARTLVVLGVVAVTFWNLTRVSPLHEPIAAAGNGNPANSLVKALDYLDRRPWSQEAALIAARSFSRLEYADDAEVFYQRAGEVSPQDLHTRAYGHLRAGHLERAIALYEQILAGRPDDLIALRRLAAVQLTRNDKDALMALADRLVRVPKGAAIGYTLLGVVQHNNENHEAAAAAFERVVELDPQLTSMPLPHRLFWTHLASNLVAVGHFDDACRYLARAVEEIPDAYLWDFLGYAYERSGKLDEAVECWNRALEMNPRILGANLNLGKLAEHRKNYPQALEYLKRAEGIAPDDYETAYHLALTYHQMGREREAAGFRKKAEALRKKSAVPAPSGLPKKLPGYAL